MNRLCFSLFARPAVGPAVHRVEAVAGIPLTRSKSLPCKKPRLGIPSRLRQPASAFWAAFARWRARTSLRSVCRVEFDWCVAFRRHRHPCALFLALLGARYGSIPSVGMNDEAHLSAGFGVAETGNRTQHLRITSAPLCQMSYLGVSGATIADIAAKIKGKA